MEKTKINVIKSTACLFLTALIWGVAFVFQAMSVGTVGALTYGGVRFLLGAASLAPLIFIFDRKKNKTEKKCGFTSGLVAGLILSAAAIAQQYGIEMTGSAGKAGFLTDLYIILVPVIGVFLKQKTGKSTWIGGLLALLGLYFLSVPDGFGNINIGDVVLIIGAVFWSFHIIVLDRFAPKVAPLVFSCTQFAVCGLLSMTGAFLFETVRWSDIRAGITPIIYGGLLSVGVAYTLQIFGQKYVSPAKASIIFSLESLFAAASAAIILGELMTLKGYLGCGLMFTGTLVSQINFKRTLKLMLKLKHTLY